ncbi:MAG: gamma-glutamylcyclotransferase family protein [Blastocatellia bacterium]
MSEYIFIYGTLSPELAPKEIAGEVEKLKFVGEGFVYGRLYDFGEFPGIKLGASARTKVHGRVYKLPSNKTTIKNFDAYEEYYPKRLAKSLYRRRLAQVELESGEKIRAWIYEYNGNTSAGNLIRGGIYSKAVV